MLNKTRLEIVKSIHTTIWVGFNIILFYLLYAVSVNDINKWVWIGIGAILVEGIVLLIFNMICPLTLIARRYSNSTKDNFDIYLPNWLAKNTKLIYTSFFIVILCMLGYRIIVNTK